MNREIQGAFRKGWTTTHGNPYRSFLNPEETGFGRTLSLLTPLKPARKRYSGSFPMEKFPFPHVSRFVLLFPPNLHTTQGGMPKKETTSTAK
jgi:hypothetical protein